MSNRVVYGNSFSENGWPMVDQGSCTWVTVPGTSVTLQIQNGWPLAILRAWAADWNAYVEPLRDADSACWTATNDVASSNHLSGTALDLNWQSHPFRVANAGVNATQIATIDEMLKFYEDTVFWGNYWRSPKDAMHSQANGNTYNNPHTGDFIARKIRADGFSTFRRGNAAQPPSDAADVLMRATGITHDKAWDIMVGVINGLRDSECNTVNRIAMWLAQIGHESAGFNATEEYQSGDESTDRWKYKGRTWIQITWQSNYAGLSKWAFGKDLIPSPTYFVDNPKKLADIQYAGLGPAWYWVVARPQINSLCDQRNLTAVTQAINGGQNGAADRKRRYDMALALGDQLLTLTQQSTGVEDDMASVPQDQWDRVYRELTQVLKSRSPLRHLNEGPIDTVAGFVLNTDGSEHVQYVLELAKLGHQPTIDLLNEVAGADAAKYPDRQQDASLARNILAAARKSWGTPASAAVAAPTVQDAGLVPALQSANAEVARLREENAQLRAQLNTTPEVSNAVAVPEPKAEPKTLGDHAGNLVDSVEGWTNAALSMDVKQQAALKASINVLTMQNGQSA